MIKVVLDALMDLLNARTGQFIGGFLAGLIREQGKDDRDDENRRDDRAG